LLATGADRFDNWVGHVRDLSRHITWALVSLLALVAAVGAQPASAARSAGSVRAARSHAQSGTATASRRRDERAAAYAGLSAARARALAEHRFGSQLRRAGRVPAFGRGVRVTRYVSPRAAWVRNTSDGRRKLAVSSIPLAAPNRAGRLGPIDMRLHRAGGELVPRAAAAPPRIPQRLADGLELGREDLAIVAAGSASGVAADGPPVDNAVFYPGVARATDLLAAPTAAGLETFFQLRAASSPERVALDLRLPRGAVLRRGGGGGAG
jgi:hypothetical protein